CLSVQSPVLPSTRQRGRPDRPVRTTPPGPPYRRTGRRASPAAQARLAELTEAAVALLSPPCRRQVCRPCARKRKVRNQRGATQLRPPSQGSLSWLVTYR